MPYDDMLVLSMVLLDRIKDNDNWNRKGRGNITTTMALKVPTPGSAGLQVSCLQIRKPN